MNLLRGTILSVLLLCLGLAIGTAFANEQQDELVYMSGEVQKKMVRYEEPKLEDNHSKNESKTNEAAEETTDGDIEKPFYYLIVNKTPYLADEKEWRSVEEGDTVTIGYEPGDVHILKTIDEE